ncbi:MAG: hypothetical protein ACRCUI_09685 [Polymorphobacter sp.]
MTASMASSAICLIQIGLLVGFTLFDIFRRRSRIAQAWRFDGFQDAQLGTTTRPHRFGGEPQAIVYLMPERATPTKRRHAA